MQKELQTQIKTPEWASAEMSTGQFNRSEAIAAASHNQNTSPAEPVFSEIADMLKGVSNYISAQTAKVVTQQQRNDSSLAMGL